MSPLAAIVWNLVASTCNRFTADANFTGSLQISGLESVAYFDSGPLPFGNQVGKASAELFSADDVAAGHRRVYRQDTLLRDVMGAQLALIDTGGILFKPLADFQFNGLMGGDLITDAFMEGCYQLGREAPSACASIYVVASKKS